MIAFRPLEKSLSRAKFDCGNPVITRWFREQAGQQERKNNVRTHLGLSTFDSEIACFYSLATHRVETSELEDSELFESRKYPVPAILIAQLGVDVRYQGKGLGALALGDALFRIAQSSSDIGFEIVIVDAIDASATSFYEKFEFERLTRNGRRLFVTVKDLVRNYPAANVG